MAPIPLTLIGIIPGHLIIGAEFTATSMIGFIALAGIIVRNSILLVEFVKHEVEDGKDIVEAVIAAGQIRMRPILITAGTLMLGAAMLFSDPIFIGMAASLFFGTLVATMLTLVVIPLGCISVRRTFYEVTGMEPTGKDTVVDKADPRVPLLPVVRSGIIAVLTWVISEARTVYRAAKSAVSKRREPKKKYQSSARRATPQNNVKSSTVKPTPQASAQSPAREAAPREKAVPPVKEAAPQNQKVAGAKKTTRKKTTKKKTTRKKVSKKKVSKKQAAQASGKATTKSATRKTTGKKRRGISLKKDLDQ